MNAINKSYFAGPRTARQVLCQEGNLKSRYHHNHRIYEVAVKEMGVGPFGLRITHRHPSL